MRLASGGVATRDGEVCQVLMFLCQASLKAGLDDFNPFSHITDLIRVTRQGKLEHGAGGRHSGGRRGDIGLRIVTVHGSQIEIYVNIGLTSCHH